MDDVSFVVINILLFGGFIFTAYTTFKEFSPWACISMITSLGMLFFINQ